MFDVAFLPVPGGQLSSLWQSSMLSEPAREV